MSRGRGSNQHADKPATTPREDLATVHRLRSMAPASTPTRDALTSLAPADLSSATTAAFARQLAESTARMISSAKLTTAETMSLVRSSAISEDAILSQQPNAYGHSVVAGTYWSVQAGTPGSRHHQALQENSSPALDLDRAYSRLARDVEGDHLSTSDLESTLSEVEAGEALWEHSETDGQSPSSMSIRHAALSVACARGSASTEERREMQGIQHQLNSAFVQKMRL